MKRIVIDPGHGGWDKGATPTDINQGGYYEAVFNWRLSKAIGDYLTANYVVDLRYTHEGDHTALASPGNLAQELRERAAVANRANADLLVSIHHDSTGNPSVRGGSLWVWTNKLKPDGTLTWLPATGNHSDPKTYPIAKKMVSRVREALGTLGVPWRWWGDPDGIACANFGVLSSTKGPALLIECFHGSNAEDVAAARKPEFIPTLAKGIGDAIADVMDLKPKTLPRTVTHNGEMVECAARDEGGTTAAHIVPILEQLKGRVLEGWTYDEATNTVDIKSREERPGVKPGLSPR